MSCLQECICNLFDKNIDEVENFIDYDDWLSRLVRFASDEGYETIFKNPDEIKELEIPVCKYLVWGMSRSGIPHSVIHNNGHLYFDSGFIIDENDQDVIIDYYHPECNHWIFGVNKIYQFVYFVKI